jgi:hypothetical protein
MDDRLIPPEDDPELDVEGHGANWGTNDNETLVEGEDAVVEGEDAVVEDDDD